MSRHIDMLQRLYELQRLVHPPHHYRERGPWLGAGCGWMSELINSCLQSTNILHSGTTVYSPYYRQSRRTSHYSLAVLPLAPAVAASVAAAGRTVEP